MFIHIKGGFIYTLGLKHTLGSAAEQNAWVYLNIGSKSFIVKINMVQLFKLLA